MTAVVGIMNKRGIAIAADSAISVTQNHETKIVNSGNKMLRLSTAQPVSVMITGNTNFIATPWDVIVRRYRQKRGDSLPSVEAVVDDFLAYIPTEKQLFYSPNEIAHIYDAIEKNFYRVVDFDFDTMAPSVPYAITDKKGNVTNLEEMVQVFRNKTAMVRKEWETIKSGPAFKNYTLEVFKKYVSKWRDLFDDLHSINYPKEFFKCIEDDLLESALLYLTKSINNNGTILVFSGFGAKEEFPSLIAVNVNGGFDCRVFYQINDHDRIHISDEKETAICSYAQSDIMEALLTGINQDLKKEVFKKYENLFAIYKTQVLQRLEECGKLTPNIEKTINEVKCLDLIQRFKSSETKRENAERQSWLKALKNYDLQDMAHLAENLVAITGFERHMTFKQESVGGPIDLAVITKNEGFVWLNRKSWYNHQDVSGRYGKFGI